MKSRGDGTAVNVAGMLTFSGSRRRVQAGRDLYAGTLTLTVTSSQALSVELKSGVRAGLEDASLLTTVIEAQLAAFTGQSRDLASRFKDSGHLPDPRTVTRPLPNAIM